jgi:hypothetical protein
MGRIHVVGLDSVLVRGVGGRGRGPTRRAVVESSARRAGSSVADPVLWLE